MDDFQNPKEIRYAGNDQAENYYTKSFNTEFLIDKLLGPVRQQGKVTARLTVLNLETDKFDTARNYNIKPDTVVILEGVFLFRKELAPFIDYKVYLDISFQESKKRATIRDPEASVLKYDTKYLPAEERYIQEHAPGITADLVINNTDTEYPKLRNKSLE
jgi:uridine kinase